MAHVFRWPTPTSFLTNILRTAVDSIPPAFYIKYVVPEGRAFDVKIPGQHTSVRFLKLPGTTFHILTKRELFVASGVPETMLKIWLLARRELAVQDCAQKYDG